MSVNRIVFVERQGGHKHFGKENNEGTTSCVIVYLQGRSQIAMLPTIDQQRIRVLIFSSCGDSFTISARGKYE